MKAEKPNISRVLVTGGRDYEDAMVIADALALLPVDAVLVHGGARGADETAAAIWEGWQQKVEEHPAQWNTYGRAAGAIRNQEMLDTGVDLVIAFPGGTGTADMVRRARKAGVEVREVA